MIMFKAVGVEPVPNDTRDIKQGITRCDAYRYVAAMTMAQSVDMSAVSCILNVDT
jgi:hypothetical protein